MSRIARIVYPDYPHHIIQRGNNKQAIFFDDNDKQFYLNLLKKYSSQCGCKIHAYCLMMNHIHLLAVPQHGSSLAKTMQKTSLTFTQFINRKYKRTGRLWECRFHSSLVDKDSYLWAVCRYIERNPVRAKIVNNPIHYKWSSAKSNTSESEKNNLIEPIWKKYVDKKEYIEFLNRADNESDIDMINKYTFIGKPIGSGNFLAYISKTLNINITPKPVGRPKEIVN